MSPETYELFIDRCEIFFPHAICVQISVAYALAKHFHRFDVRKEEKDENGDPVRYFEHVRRVALILLDELALPDSDCVICALLHDAVEDTRLAPEAITLVCGADNSRRVMLMSKKPKQGFHQRLLDHADYKVLMVKGADRLDNLRSFTQETPRTFIEKQIKETRELYYPLMATLVERTPPGLRAKAQRLQSLIHLWTEAISRGESAVLQPAWAP